MLNFSVNAKLCTRCGQCVRDCVVHIIEQTGKRVPRIPAARAEDCMECQHCLAVCPTGALSILGHDPAKSLPLTPETLPTAEQMMRLVRGRRSVRQYHQKNVPATVLDPLLAALGNVPTGVNSRRLTFNVIADQAVMNRFRRQAMKALAKAVAAGRIAERFAFVQGLHERYQQTGEDIIFRGAPHALIVSAPPDTPCGVQDVTLTLAYFELLAQSAGLGTVWCGLLLVLLEAVPELKPVLGLPADHTYYPMLFGLPAVHYARTVQRDDAMTVRYITL